MGERDFLVEIFQKVPKNAFLTFFFKNLPEAQKIWSNLGLYIGLVDLKKKKFFFENPPHPLEKFLDRAWI